MSAYDKVIEEAARQLNDRFAEQNASLAIVLIEVDKLIADGQVGKGRYLLIECIGALDKTAADAHVATLPPNQTAAFASIHEVVQAERKVRSTP